MASQIFDRRTVGIPGTVTPAALTARDDAIAARFHAETSSKQAMSARDIALDARDSAMLALAAAEAVGNTNDGIMAGVAQNSSSAFSALMSSKFVSSTIPGLRIIPTLRGEKPAEGDGLIVYYELPGGYFYKDFSGDIVGNAPGGMKKLGTENATVATFSTGAGGKVLVTPSSGFTGYALDSATSDPFAADSELLVRWYSGSAHGVSIVFNVDAITNSFYRISYNRENGRGYVRWTTRRNGSNTSTPQVEIPALPVDTWCMARARLADGVIHGKVWPAMDAEPNDWQYQRPVSDMPPVLNNGPHGVGAVDTFLRIDQITHATGGRRASLP